MCANCKQCVQTVSRLLVFQCIPGCISDVRLPDSKRTTQGLVKSTASNSQGLSFLESRIPAKSEPSAQKDVSAAAEDRS